MACEWCQCASIGGVRWWFVGLGGVCGRVLFAPPLYVGAGAGLWVCLRGRCVPMRAYASMGAYMHACGLVRRYAQTPKPVCALAYGRTPVCARLRSGVRAPAPL